LGERASVKTETIDQSASEVQLHRVLYLLKFLRAMVLHCFLMLAAVLLFALAGIRHVYPLADDWINLSQAHLIEDQRKAVPLGSVVYYILVSVVFLGFVAFMIWLYRSITRVRRFALRFQAAIFFILALAFANAKWPELKFAFQNLNPGFAVLAALGIGVNFLVIPMSIAIGLWGVARSPERSSLLATLDPRLAPNLWVYINKLLDLPRTPLRTARTAAAYVLAFAGVVMLIASVTYLFTVGGTSNKLATLATVCNETVMSACVEVSANWAREVPLWLLLAVGGVKGASLLQSTAKRLGGLGVSDVLKKPNERFVLYLRPFDTDDVVLPKPRLPLLSRLFSFTPFPVRIEQELFDVADGFRPLIAIGKPGAKSVVGGVAYRAYLDDSEWQEYVTTKIRSADRIVMVLKDTDGVHWEFDRVVDQGAVMKTLFLCDPAIRTREKRETLEKMVVPKLQNAGLAAERFDWNPQLIGFFFQKGSLVEIINHNRTATSYRTAFSHFLAESSG
jgi:hypothetical protein